MLHINVYLVSRVWYSPAEGGCWYDAGEPLASIPVLTDQEKGKSYYLSDGIHIQECQSCNGTGTSEEEDEETGEVYQTYCLECGEIPSDSAETWKLIKAQELLFKLHPGRYEHIRVALEKHFARPYPETRPHYE